MNKMTIVGCCVFPCAVAAGITLAIAGYRNSEAVANQSAVFDLRTTAGVQVFSWVKESNLERLLNAVETQRRETDLEIDWDVMLLNPHIDGPWFTVIVRRYGRP